MRLVCMSDTHLRHGFEVPDGDVLIHAGDALLRGSRAEWNVFQNWFVSLPHEHKIFVPGNHDFICQLKPRLVKKQMQAWARCHVLSDSGVGIDGITFYGSPWQPEFFNWAYNLPRGEPLRKKWAMIPSGVDVLITHGPPYGIGDLTTRSENVGCMDLRQELIRINPRAHVFGHIHNCAGRLDYAGTTFINASICDEHYLPVNAPIVLDLPAGLPSARQEAE
jgi:predicted phosphodiesterase